MTQPAIGFHSSGTGNLLPLLHEISHALDNFMTTGNSRTIDLRTLPLAPGEEQQLLKFLGQGEVRASIDALGRSEILESRFSGVWITTHFNGAGEIMGRFIEITPVPRLLTAQPEDVALGRKALDQLIGAGMES